MQEIKVILQEFFICLHNENGGNERTNETARGENELKAIHMC